jgi:hypothetical protein
MEQVPQVQGVTTPSVLTSYIDQVKPDANRAAKLYEIFSEGAEGFTLCGFTNLMYDPSNPSALHAVPQQCDCWLCRNCGPKLKHKWYSTFMDRMSREPYLEIIDMPASKFDAFRKKLSRANKKTPNKPYQYGRFLRSADRTKIRVITNLECGGTPVPMDLLEPLIIQCVAEAPWVRRPIYASRAWLPKAKAEEEVEERTAARRREKKARTKLVKIGPTARTPIEIGIIAGQLGIDHVASGYDGFSRTILLPRQWMGKMAFSSFLIQVGVRRRADSLDLDLVEIERRARE